ncbi:MAG: YvcK family protein [Tissierellia bacterium]|nr:YvcK family protein [Tissierellia bacterium]
MDYRYEPHVVVIGGGTGLSILLSGLKRFTSYITAVVTVADDGGGSGVLREDIGMLPPGDIRACILALANMEPKMEKLLNYRFEQGALKGQSFGNLFLAAMNGIYGRFDLAVQETSSVLAVTGKVFPVTLEDIALTALFEDGQVVTGESIIPNYGKNSRSKIVQMSTSPKEIYTSSHVLEALDSADIIVLGPGSLYTSVIPNLLVQGIVPSIINSNAPKVYICNVMTQSGETYRYSVKDHVQAILDHSAETLLDYVVINDAQIPEVDLVRYSEEESEPVMYTKEDELFLEEKDIKPLLGDFYQVKSGYIRHNSLALGQKLITIADMHKTDKSE